MSVLTTSAFDERTWQRCLKGYDEVRTLINRARFYRPDAEVLASDLFFACFQLEPKLRADASGDAADVLRDLFAHPRWLRTRELIGDNVMHALGASCELLTWLLRYPNDTAFAFTEAMERFIGTIESLAALQKAYFEQRKPMTLENQMTLANKARGNPKLGRIAKIAGRLKNVAMRVHQSRTVAKQDDVRDIELGNKLPQVLPAELAALGIAQAQPLFYKKYDERRLAQRQVDGATTEGQGPIIVALDDSLSMTAMSGVEDYSREEWAKAILLGLFEVAQVEKRDFAVIHFGTSADVKTWQFKAGQASVEDLLACVDFFFCSMGTAFTGWMREALALIDSSTFNKADVIVLSDGHAFINEQVQAQWDTMRKTRGMRCYGIMIGSESAGGLTFVCDRVMSMATEQDEDLITSTVFAI